MRVVEHTPINTSTNFFFSFFGVLYLREQVCVREGVRQELDVWRWAFTTAHLWNGRRSQTRLIIESDDYTMVSSTIPIV